VRAELVGAERRQFVHEAAKRRAGGGKDDDGSEAAVKANSPVEICCDMMIII
jgi:hypothetical protein